MKLSSIGRHILESREGNSLKAYKDTVGVWTIGYGHTHFDGPPIPVEGMTISQQQADNMLTKDIVQYENVVNTSVKVPLRQNEFDALASICYNVPKALSPQSSIVKRLNAGDKKGAAEAILMYNKPPEIMGRRRGEYKQFLTPYASQPIVTQHGPTVAAAGIGAAIAAYWSQYGMYWPVLAGVAVLGLFGFILYKYLKG